MWPHIIYYMCGHIYLIHEVYFIYTVLCVNHINRNLYNSTRVLQENTLFPFQTQRDITCTLYSSYIIPAS